MSKINTPSARAEPNPIDLYCVRSMLTEEEQMVQDSVGKFVDD